MLSSPISVTVGSDTVSLKRINQDGYAAEYFGQSTDGLRRFTMTIKHTLPPKGGTGESHLIRIDVEHFDSSANHLRTDSFWTVMKTVAGPQVNSKMSDLALGAIGMMTASTNAVLLGVLGRES